MRRRDHRSSMETTTGACLIDRLPEDLLVSIISLTSPVDACRAAAVSRAFRAAADSDAAWSRFVPSEVLRSCSHMLPPWRKPLFLHLSGLPVLFSVTGTPLIMWLDRPTGARCYVLPARALHISDAAAAWAWIRVDDPGDSIWASEAAMMMGIGDLEIRGKIRSGMLSRGTAYVAYMLFGLAVTGIHGLDYPLQETSLTVTAAVGGGSGGGAGEEATTTTTTIRRQACCLHGYLDYGDGAGKVPRRHVTEYVPGRGIRVIPLGEGVVLPRRRADGWMELELELGEFCRQEEGDGDGEVSMSLTAGTKLRPYAKRGLILLGIEIRVKQRSGQAMSTS